MGVVIVTDSTANLDSACVDSYNIKVVSLSVNFPDQSYKEMEIDNNEFYKIMAKYSVVPTSSQPSPGSFYEVFEEAVSQDHSVVGIFISAGLSGTYSSAVTASRMIFEKYPRAKIELVDSRATIMQLGYGVIAAAKAAVDGQSMENAAHAARVALDRSIMYFVPRTLEYLKKGGRIGGAAALFGTLLRIKPILYLEEGKVAVYDKARTFEKAFNRIMEIFGRDQEMYGIEEVTVQHINCIDDALKAAKDIKDRWGLSPTIGSIRPVIGLHVGPGTLGLSYHLKNSK